MSFLTLASVPLDAMNQPITAFCDDRPCDLNLIFFEDAEHLLAILAPARLEIIRLLREEGPAPADAIAACLDRDTLMVSRDLGVLLDAQVIDLERDARYVFGFEGIRVMLQFPPSGLRGSDHDGQTIRSEWRFE
jgi:predicted transcriptional regulator